MIGIYPDAAVLAHPESPVEILKLADLVGSTKEIIEAVTIIPKSTFIVATDRGIFYKLREKEPNKIFIEAPNGGAGATCNSCAHCPWMEMNQLPALYNCVFHKPNEIFVNGNIITKAKIPLNKMLNFKKETMEA